MGANAAWRAGPRVKPSKIKNIANVILVHYSAKEKDAVEIIMTNPGPGQP